MQKNRADKKPLTQPKLPAEGPQGVDKAPGEDPAGKPGTGLKKELTGKKVDGDPKIPLTNPQSSPEPCFHFDFLLSPLTAIFAALNYSLVIANY